MFNDIEKKRKQIAKSLVRIGVVWLTAWFIVFEFWDDELSKTFGQKQD